MKYRNAAKSYDGWFVVSAIERFERLDDNPRNSRRRCTAWENVHLVRADTVEAAYDKVIKYYGQADKEYLTELKGKKGRWVFEGVTDLVPIYECLDDLAEILWTEHRNVSVNTVKNRVYSKEELLSLYTEPIDE